MVEYFLHALGPGAISQLWRGIGVNPAGLRSGAVVVSTAGRDRGRAFLVVGLGDEGRYALVVDGQLRRVAKPKKKNPRHLEYRGMVGEELLRKFENGKAISDQEVERALLLMFEGSRPHD